jgi:hypothetical protein
MPNGQWASVPDDVDEDQAREVLMGAYPHAFGQASASPEEDALDITSPVDRASTGEPGIIAAARAGLREQGDFFPALKVAAGALMGDQEMVTGGREWMEERQRETADIYAPGASVETIVEAADDSYLDAAGETAEFAKEQIAMSGGAMAAPFALAAGTTVATGGAGAVAAPAVFFGALFGQHFANDIERQLENGRVTPEDIQVLNAVLAASGQTALDTIGVVIAGLGGKLVNTAVGKAVQSSGAKALGKTITDMSSTAPGKRFVAAIAEEPFAETGQQALERLQAGESITPQDREDYYEYYNAFFGGMAGGVGLGGVGAAGSAIRKGKVRADQRQVGDEELRQAEVGRQELEGKEALTPSSFERIGELGLPTDPETRPDEMPAEPEGIPIGYDSESEVEPEPLSVLLDRVKARQDSAVEPEDSAVEPEPLSVLLDRVKARQAQSDQARAGVEGPPAAPEGIPTPEETEVGVDAIPPVVPESKESVAKRVIRRFNKDLRYRGLGFIRTGLIDSVNKVPEGRAPKGNEAMGRFDPSLWMIGLSMDNVKEGDSVEEVAAELGKPYNQALFHALERRGVISKTRWNAMLRYAQENGYIDRATARAEAQGVEGGQGISEREIQSEAVAEAFGDFAVSTPKGFEKEANRLKEIASSVKRIGKALRGEGFQSAEHAFRELGSPEAGRMWNESRVRGSYLMENHPERYAALKAKIDSDKSQGKIQRLQERLRARSERRVSEEAASDLALPPAADIDTVVGAAPGLEMAPVTEAVPADGVESPAQQQRFVRRTNFDAQQRVELNPDSPKQAENPHGSPAHGPISPQEEAPVYNDTNEGIGWGRIAWSGRDGNQRIPDSEGGRLPVVVPRGRDVQDKGISGASYGAAALDKKNPEIIDRTRFTGWQELLTSFFEAMDSGPVKLGDVNGITMLNPENNRLDFIWEDKNASEGQPPIVVVLQRRDGKAGPYYSVSTISVSGAYGKATPIPMLSVMNRYGPEATANDVLIAEDNGRARRMTGSDHNDASMDDPAPSDPLERAEWESFSDMRGGGHLWNQLSAPFRDGTTLGDWQSRFRYNWVDKHHGILKLKSRLDKLGLIDTLKEVADTSAYVAAMFSDRSNAYVAAMYKYGGIEWIGNVDDGYAKVTNLRPDHGEFEEGGETYQVFPDARGGLINIIHSAFVDPRTKKRRPRGKKLLEKLHRYSIAVRGKRLDSDGKVVPVTEEDMVKWMGYADEYPEIKIMHDRLQEWNSRTVEFLIKTEMLTPEMGKKWMEYSDYVPLYLNMTGDTKVGIRNIMQGTDSEGMFGSLVGQKISKRFTGFTLKPGEQIMPMMEAIARNQQAAITSGLRNVSAIRAIDGAISAGWARRLTRDEFNRSSTDDAQHVTIRRGGQEEHYEVYDRLLFDSLTGTWDGAGPLLQILGKPAQWLRTWVTKNPEFMLRNIMRDSIASYLTSGADMNFVTDPVGNVVKGVTRSLRNKGVALSDEEPEISTREELERLGVIGGYELQSADNLIAPVINVSRFFEGRGGKLGESIGRRFSEQERINRKLFPEHMRTTPSKMMKKIWKGLGSISDQVESGTREAVFEDVFMKTGSEAEAALHAVEVLNFGRHGASPFMRSAITMIPFMNSQIQGMDLLARSITGRYSSRKMSASEIKRLLFFRSMNIALTSAAYTALMLSLDDDRYNGLEDWERDAHWIIPMPGDTPWMKWATPHELGVMLKLIPEMITREALGSPIKNVGDSLKREVSNLFIPIGWAQGKRLPTFVQPIVDLVTNRNPLTDNAIVNNFGAEGDLLAYNSSDHVDSVYEMLAESMRHAGINIAPTQLSHLARATGGTLLATMVSIVSLGIDHAEASLYNLGVIDEMPNLSPSKAFKDTFPFKGVFAGTDGRGYSNEIRSWYGKLQSIEKAISGNILDRDYDEVRSLHEEFGHVLRNKGLIEYMEKNRKRIDGMIRDVRRSPLSAEQKRAAIAAHIRDRNDLLRNVHHLKSDTGAK